MITLLVEYFLIYIYFNFKLHVVQKNNSIESIVSIDSRYILTNAGCLYGTLEIWWLVCVTRYAALI